jgi:flagellar biosynthetic protein FliP
MSVSPFLRITIVLHFLRQALGTQGTPSNQVLLGLALFLSMLIMQPVGQEIYHKAWEPVSDGQMSVSKGVEEGSKPLKSFLLRFAREKDLKLSSFQKPRPAHGRPRSAGHHTGVHPPIEDGISNRRGVVPAISGDRSVVASVLSRSDGAVTPVMISAPFKILLFVLVDGWTLWLDRS